ncbi:PIG-L deacetylase family protein [Streptomyces hygroscopicus]|uniref:LmbE family N-acetylglucosaminyl deacetylase n=1 Tax=Streptomyces demainii TaxID=588122 RepID=A0ABT9KHN8_9ACTN|nr:PIG-L family deacetylase [Streptomyces demainii]MDP9607919.1 LmbE family N-acetylglucosaminyl deacetylase [Streptomyces demainii]
MTCPSRSVLAVAAHADDEVLGAGGTLAAHIHAGDRVHLLVLSASAASRPGGGRDQVRAHRAGCVGKVAALFGAEVEIADFPDNAFDTAPRLTITQTIEAAVARFKPQIVYTHSTADLSLDHRITAEAVAAATRPQPGSTVTTVLAWEVRSATEWGTGDPFRPTWFQPLTAQDLAVKEQALEIYASEMRPWPHTRSARAVLAAAHVRGAQVGYEAAEAFEVVRHTVVIPA